MRHVLVVGLIVLAALLPLAAVPVAIFVLDVSLVVVGVALCIVDVAPPALFRARAASRAPPSR